MAKMTVALVGRASAAMRMISGSAGIARKTSTMRIAAMSTQPLSSPAPAPTSRPPPTPSAGASTATSPEERAPQISWERMSCPESLVPSRCAPEGEASEGPATARGS
jgi:hypothetical protein